MSERFPDSPHDAGAARDTHNADQFLTLAQVSRAVASILDLDALLDQVVTIVHRQFGYPFVHLYIVDSVRQQITYRAGSGFRSQALRERGLSYALDDPQGIIPWVARNGSTVVANDVDTDPRYRAATVYPPTGGPTSAREVPIAPRAPDTRAELTVPLVFGDRVLGVLDVQSDRRDAFGDDDRLLFEALADSVAIAIRNANLYSSERWRRQVAESLHEVAGLLSEVVLLEEVLDTILVELVRTLPCDLAAVWLLEDDELRVAALRGPDVYAYTADTIPLPATLPDESTWIGQALRSERPIIRALGTHPQAPPDPLGEALDFPADHSAIAVPLRAGDQRLGLLTLAHRAAGQYGAESRAILATFASYAAVAIENARLYQEAQEQALLSTVMLQVAEAAQSQGALDQVLETIAELASQLTVDEDGPFANDDRPCAIFLWDSAITAFVPAAAYGLDAAQRGVFGLCRIELGDVPAFDKLLATGAPTVLCAEDAQYEPPPVLSAVGFESLLLLPLLSQDAVLGALLVECPDVLFKIGARESFLEQRLAILQAIAHQTAISVENAWLREAQQAEAYVSAALLQVSQAVNAYNTLDDILGAVVRITPILIGTERCLLYLWSETDVLYRLAHAYGLSQEEQAALSAHEYAPGEFALLDRVRDTDSLAVHSPPERSTDTGDLAEVGDTGDLLPPELRAVLASEDDGQLGTLLVVPLSIKGQVLGALLLEETHAPGRADTRHGAQGMPGAGQMHGVREKRIEIMTGIAHQAAMAIQNERFQQEQLDRERLQREIQLARDIQQTFIPSQLPHLQGWELAAMWRAARQVAGDFYDLIELPGERLGIVIADVADKGMPAALFMALTRTLVRAAATEETSPASALTRVNDLLLPDAQHGMFVTAVYAVLSLRTGELCYANAGHCLPLVLRPGSQTFERLPKGGTALGVLSSFSLDEHVTALAPGDSVLFYTDGVTEALSPRGELFGEERLLDATRSIVQAADGRSAQTLLETLLAYVQSFARDAPASDDLTAVVLKRTP